MLLYPRLMRNTLCMSLLWLLVYSLPTPIYAASTTPSTTSRSNPPSVYVVETGHNIGPAVKKFYDSNGGATIFGQPLTEVITENGGQVQYFERARFELQNGGQIGLTRLGSLVTAGRTDPAFTWLNAAPDSGRQFFAKSGHTLGGAFGWFWRQHGGIAIFGYPISEEFTEKQDATGAPMLVQYFERAQFIYQSDGTIRLGDLGSIYAQQHNLAPELRAPAAPIVQLSASTTTFPPHSSGAQNIFAAAKHFDGMIVQPGQSVSFLKAVGPILYATGFVDGSAIVNDQIVTDIGGGICQTSTALYRAVLAAGLQIDERHSHSRMLGFFADAPGTDAAVYTPDIDLRWHNDTASPILIVVTPDPYAGKMTMALWGVNDGRTVTVTAPTTTKLYAPGLATWVYDDSLAPGTTQQTDPGVQGRDVRVSRIVLGANKSVLHRDIFVTHYNAVGGIIRYGPIMQPNTTMGV